MWDLPGPGLKPVSPALAGGFLTTAPPGKPPIPLFWPHPLGYPGPQNSTVQRAQACFLLPGPVQASSLGGHLENEVGKGKMFSGSVDGIWAWGLGCPHMSLQDPSSCGDLLQCGGKGSSELKVETAPGEGAKPRLPNSQCGKAWGSFAEVVLLIACSSVWWALQLLLH